MELEILVNNGISNVAILTTSESSIATRVLQEFMDIMRYEQGVEFICIKRNDAVIPILVISLLSHTKAIVNGVTYPFIDAVDMVTNRISELWED